MSRIERALEDALRRRETLGDRMPAGRHASEGVETETKASRRPSIDVRTIPSGDNFYDLSQAMPFISAALEESSVIAEQYRRLCLNIAKRVTPGEGNVLLVTSSVRGEGKTITAINLACMLARSIDHTVLLVDADLRRSRVHEYLGLKAEKGLADYLSHEDGQLSDFLIRPGLGKLVLLQGGTQVENPSELLVSLKMQRLISELKSRYPDRFIIIDAGPALEVADPATLASWVDGVIFVVRERQIPQSTVVEGFESIRESKVLGVVLNAVAPYLVAKGEIGGYGYGMYGKE